MPENKFDLIKTLSGQQLYTPINYGTSYLDPNFVDNAINNVRETYPLLFINEQKEETEEEKKKRIEEEIKKAADKSNQIWSDLGNSEDVYEGYNAHESDPQKREEFRRNGDMVAGIGSTIATLPFTAGMMGGVPAIATTVTGTAGGYAGAYGGQQLGQYLDNKYGGNTTPYLSTAGGLAGGILGGGLGYKGLVKLGNAYTPTSLGKTMLTGEHTGWWGKQFGQDVLDELTTQSLKKSIIPYGTVKGYGPTKEVYTLFERPSTYFKDATYAGTPGTYAGKKVPTWQLPKGQRNQPYNPTATERVYSVLGRNPNVSTEGINTAVLENIPMNRALMSMYDFLKKHGVDVKNLTLADLENLYDKRIHAIRIASGKNYNLAIPDSGNAFSRYWNISGYDPEGLIGEISVTSPRSLKYQPGANVDIVYNATRADGKMIYHPITGWKTITPAEGRTPISGVSQRMYDAAIPTVQQTKTAPGLLSGGIYNQPQRSLAVMEHYPNKQIVDYSGVGHGENLDPTKVTTRNNPVYLLTHPSGRYTHIPTKSISFFPSVIKDGKITTNVNHGSIFLEDGGKIENPDH